MLRNIYLRNGKTKESYMRMDLIKYKLIKKNAMKNKLNLIINTNKIVLLVAPNIGEHHKSLSWQNVMLDGWMDGWMSSE